MTNSLIRARAIAVLAVLAALAAGCASQPDATQCSTGIDCPEGTQCAAVQAVCIINNCGNGHLDPGEVCDDGNIMDGDGCSANCLSLEVCGNGIKDPGEVCDLGSANGDPSCVSDPAGDNCCSANCQSNETCGNGILDPGEVCDLGSANGAPDCVVDAAGDNCCSANCKSNETCGNCIVDPGETCDTCANTGTPNPNCEPGCKIGTGCGNGVVDPGEQCDDGNTDNNDDCTNQCTINVCGDGVIDSDGVTHHETCDDGSNGVAVETADCNIDCTLAKCGDDKVNQTAGEQCDNGSDNGATKNCTDVCKINVCGDGKVDDEAPGIEQCDDGNQVNNDGCSNSCTLPSCGNGIVDQGEDCDDANTINTDGCVSCHYAKCGDGFTEAGVEQCDGSAVNGHACSASCTLEVCGNKIIDPGETCDDGNTTSGDGCSATCQVEFCGDGVKNDAINGSGEACDPAGTTSPNTPAQCNSDCTLSKCGDGKVDHAAGEQCDDGSNNGTTGDACSSTCTQEHCGDGVTEAQFGENCDNGSANSINGPCLPWCQLAVCGDGDVEQHSNVSGAETCDDGSANGTTACPYGAESCTVCTSGCKIGSGTTSFCGDGHTDTANGEQCDNVATNGQTECAYKGTNVAGNTCTVCAACQTQTASGPYCGDADVTNGEQCDNGFAHNGTGACSYGSKSCTVCSSTCTNTAGTVFAFCGDGTKNGPEACDSGVGGVETDSSTCNKDCTTPSCGDGYVNTKFTPPGASGPEQCEPPGTDVCDTTCRLKPICGDGVCSNGENSCSCPADCSGVCTGVCGDNTAETGEQCDGTDLNGASCTSLGYASGTLKCFAPPSANKCKYDTSNCAAAAPVCGNGVQETGEECDKTDLDSATCVTLGYAGGTLKCDASCNYDTSACTTAAPVCGNGVQETGEECDKTDLDSATCVTLGYAGGTLACNSSCNYDTSGCTAAAPVCGNGVQEAGEECDKTDLDNATCVTLGYSGGTLACNSSCNYDTSGCTP